MARLICYNDHVFDECDLEWIEESRGEFWGMPCSERVPVCPFCRTDGITDYEEPEEEEEED